ncbi:MAG: hypothetical protein LBN29_12405 [Mediterranea sp.]|jgi:hypothetical protein|nr:hypothetical protein [Mediterranea sp.]
MEKDIILPQIKNWRIREIIQHVSIVSEDSTDYKYDMIEQLHLPLSTKEEYENMRTDIGWDRMPQHFIFDTDIAGKENEISKAFMASALGHIEAVIVPCGWKKPAVKIPTKLFIEDWEGLFSSIGWESVMFSDDFTLIMEISNKYYLHSNFFIME